MSLATMSSSSGLLISLVGTGRMGRRVLDHLQHTPYLVGVGVRSAATALAVTALYPKLSALITDDLHDLWHKADVIIDVSHPDSWLSHACTLPHRPVVVGTTGWQATHEDALTCYAQNAPVLRAPNAALSHVRFQRCLAAVLHILPEAAWTLLETHHAHKKDAPSGTAHALQATAHCEGFVVDMISLRAGQSPPTHEIRGCDAHEKITLRHEVFDPHAYVVGLMAAARWLKGRRPGLYTMHDVVAEIDQCS